MARHTTNLTGVIFRDSITNGIADKTYYIRYKDNDNKDKAVKLYQNKIMPFVEKNMSQEEIEKFKGYFEEIKK